MSDSSPDAPDSSGLPPASPGIPELVDLGQRLRRAREGRGIGVAELADRLHLAPEQLIALEHGDRLHLHEPVFVIAQAKRVAQALGVDVSEQVDSLRHSRLMEPPAPTAAPMGTAPPPEDPGPSPTSSWGLAAAIAGLTLLLGMVVAQGIRHWPPQWNPAPPASRSGGAGQPAGGEAAAAGSPGVLLLRSEEPSWLEVRDAEGQVLFSGLLEKEGRFRLGKGLRVLAGRPDLVTAIVGGGAPRRLGTISEVDWQDFAAPSAPPPTPAP